MSKYSAVIFDLDGVICHTDKFHYEAWKKISDEIGVEFNSTINNKLRGVSRLESFEIILEKYNGIMSDEDKNYYLEKKNEIYKDLLKNMSKNDVSKEVKETLEELKKKRIKIAIGSSSKNARFILEKIGLLDIFDAISDGNNIKKSKPDPEVFLKAADLLKIDYNRCLVIEDAISGIEAAKNAGMDAAGIGDAKKTDLCDYRLDSIFDIVNIF